MGDWSVEVFLAVAAAAGTAPKLLAFLLLMVLVFSRGTYGELSPPDVTGNVGFILGGVVGASLGGYLVGIVVPGNQSTWLIWVGGGVLLLCVWAGQIVGYFASFRVFSQDMILGRQRNLFCYMTFNGAFWAVLACVPGLILALLWCAGIAVLG